MYNEMLIGQKLAVKPSECRQGAFDKWILDKVGFKLVIPLRQFSILVELALINSCMIWNFRNVPPDVHTRKRR